MKTKICSKCGVEYPATREYFYKQPGGLFGLNAACKKCCAECDRKRYQANREKILKQGREYYWKNREKALEHNWEYRQNNKEQIAEYSRKYREANKETLAEYRRKWAENNPGYHSQKYREWAENNPEKVRLYAHNRRTRLARSVGSHTLEELQIRLQNQHNKCFYCGCDLDDKYHVDHLMPLSRGGSNWIENIVIACASCNIRKKDKLPVTFIASLPNKVWS